MFIVKLLIGALSVVLCLIIAKNKAEYIKERYYYFNSLVNSCDLIKTDLLYKKRSIREILSVNFQSSDFLQTLNAYFEDEKWFPSYLTNEELVLVTEYFSVLGKGDTTSQINALTSFKEEFSKIAIEKKKEFEKSYKVTLKVGFSIGIMLFILVI